MDLKNFKDVYRLLFKERPAQGFTPEELKDIFDFMTFLAEKGQINEKPELYLTSLDLKYRNYAKKVIKYKKKYLLMLSAFSCLFFSYISFALACGLKSLHSLEVLVLSTFFIYTLCVLLWYPIIRKIAFKSYHF